MRAFFLVLLLFNFNSASSQISAHSVVRLGLLEVAVLDIEPSGNIILNFNPPTEAGNPIVPNNTNTSKWINYTSATTGSSTGRKITASISEVIPGVAIKLQAGSAMSTGAGIRGVPTGQVTLSTNAQVIISGIKGAYTGNGVSNGHLLTISLETSEYQSLIARTNKQITIVYTIID